MTDDMRARLEEALAKQQSKAQWPEDLPSPKELKALRTKLGLSLPMVAQVSGIAQSTYSGYELEKFNPKGENLEKLRQFISLLQEKAGI